MKKAAKKQKFQSINLGSKYNKLILLFVILKASESGLNINRCHQ